MIEGASLVFQFKLNAVREMNTAAKLRIVLRVPLVKSATILLFGSQDELLLQLADALIQLGLMRLISAAGPTIIVYVEVLLHYFGHGLTQEIKSHQQVQA